MFLQERIISRDIHIFDTDAGAVLELLSSEEGVDYAVRESTGEVTVRLYDTDDGSLVRVTDRLYAAFGRRVYGTDTGSLQEAVVRELKRRGLKLAAAESLTGGLVTKRITEVPGASDVIECGVCSYSNRIKHELLGVSRETLDKYTEYSRETAREMAAGVRRLAGADIGVSTTGVAGPGPDGDKPAGSVYVGVCAENYNMEYELQLSGGGSNGRAVIRELSASHALFAVLEYLSRFSP